MPKNGTLHWQQLVVSYRNVFRLWFQILCFLSEHFWNKTKSFFVDPIACHSCFKLLKELSIFK